MPRFWVWALPGTQAVVASAADVAQGVEPAKAGLAEAQAAVEEMEAGSPELPQRRGGASILLFRINELCLRRYRALSLPSMSIGGKKLYHHSSSEGTLLYTVRNYY